MLNQQYTKGPWSIDSNDLDLITADIDGNPVAEIWSVDRGGKRALANATLIAAAPDMVEALKAIRDHVIYGDKANAITLALSEAALRKAGVL